MEHRSCIFRFADVEVDERSFSVTKAGEVLPLEPKVFKVLQFLLHHPGRVVTKEELLDAVWNDCSVSESSLTRSVATLRRLLGDDIDEPRYIATVPTVGYRFLCPATVTEDGFSPADTADVLRESTRPTSAAPQSPPPQESHRPHKRHLLVAAAGVVVALAAPLIAWWRIPPAVPMVESVVQLTDDGEPKGNTVSDGSRIYFYEGQAGSFRIAQVPVTGGAAAPLKTPFANSYVAAVKPDGSALLALVSNNESHLGPLWLIPLPAGEPRRLGNFETQNADVFPDGRIVFAQINQGTNAKETDIKTDCFIADKDGRNPRKLISLPGSLGDLWVAPDGQRTVLRVAPDGQRILLSHEADGDRWLLDIAADGTGLRKLRKLSPDECCFTWTLDEKYLVYQSRNAQHSDIWLLPIKTGPFRRPGKPIRLTNGPLRYSNPYPSGDGKQIFALGTKQRGELVRYDRKSHQFESFLSGISATDPTFSRDGKWVAYASYPDHTLWRSRSNGSERMQLTYPPIDVLFPFISPDGMKVAFHTDKNKIFVISMEGGQPQRIVEEGSWAIWSPDGNYLSYHSFQDDGQKIVDVRTGKKSAVPSGGNWITQDTLVGPNKDETKFVTFSLKTHKKTDLGPKDLGSIVNVSISPDSKYLYFTTGGADPKVERIRFSDQQMETIASLKDFHPVLNYGFTQVNVAPDGSPIFTRDTGYQEIYALNIRWP